MLDSMGDDSASCFCAVLAEAQRQWAVALASGRFGVAAFGAALAVMSCSVSVLVAAVCFFEFFLALLAGVLRVCLAHGVVMERSLARRGPLLSRGQQTVGACAERALSNGR